MGNDVLSVSQTQVYEVVDTSHGIACRAWPCMVGYDYIIHDGWRLVAGKGGR